MNRRVVLDLNNHTVYYIKLDKVSYYLTVPKHNMDTNISIELKSKMDNFNLDMNDEIWVMENVKSTFSYIDDYNITLILPVLDSDSISKLEKIDQTAYDGIDRIIGTIINDAYRLLRECNKKINSEIILINNDRYKTFINWFTSRYKERVICKNLLEVIQMYNINATSYKKFETPAITFVVGSYGTEVDAPKVQEKVVEQPQKLVPQTSSGFSSYIFLVVLTIVVSLAIAFAAFMIK